MRTYTVQSKINGLQHEWLAFAGAFSVFEFRTTDRRQARRIVRLARRLGYRVRFTVCVDPLW